ncbi:hypothetical protein GJ496_008055 [Pomphorhynchus laevis]|nr:hypothetical protein GJ496_008055 [Pomphorhynchus laevis]KAI0990606.1 hypothetical protein GJ496_008055 [Pomphorhynchus laevis]
MVVRKADSICNPSGRLTNAYALQNCKVANTLEINAQSVTSIDSNAFDGSTHQHILIHGIKNSKLVINIQNPNIYSLEFDDIQFKHDHFTKNTLIVEGADKVKSVTFENAKNLIFDSRFFPLLTDMMLRENGLYPYYKEFPLIYIANTSLDCASLTQINRPENVDFMRIEGTESKDVMNLLHFSSLRTLEFYKSKLSEVYIPRSVKKLSSVSNAASSNSANSITCPKKTKATPNVLTVNGKQFSVISTNINFVHNANLECIKKCS